MNPDLKVTQEAIDHVRGMIEHSPNQLIQLAGFKVIDLSERHVRIECPLNVVHINHVGTAYAISMMMLMEVGGSSLIGCTYGIEKYVAIIKQVDIRFLKPCITTIVCDLSMTEEEARERIATVEERGRGSYMLPVKLIDKEANIVAEADFNFYLLPADIKF